MRSESRRSDRRCWGQCCLQRELGSGSSSSMMKTMRRSSGVISRLKTFLKCSSVCVLRGSANSSRSSLRPCVLCRTGGELAYPNFPLFNQEVAPLTFVAEFRSPHASVRKLEEHCRASSAGRLHGPDGVIRFRFHTVLPFIASGAKCRFSGRAIPEHKAATWVSRSCAQTWHAHSLP
jgi:hypothetical protein